MNIHSLHKPATDICIFINTVIVRSCLPVRRFRLPLFAEVPRRPDVRTLRTQDISALRVLFGAEVSPKVFNQSVNQSWIL